MKIQRIAGSLLALSLTLADRHSLAEPAPAELPPASRSGGPVTARLTWDRALGAEDCIAEDSLVAAVNKRWGRDVLRRDGASDLVLHGTIGPKGEGRWGARLEMRRADGSSLGSREIATQAKDCVALDDSIALAAGLMLDMSRQRMEEERSAAAGAAKDPRPLEGPSIQIPPQRSPPRAAWHSEANARAEALAGLLPGATLGLRPGVAIEPPAFWRLEAGATFWLPSETTEGGRGARFAAWSVDFAICPLTAAWRQIVKFRGCVSQRLGLIRARGIGFSRSEQADEASYSIGLRGSASWIVAPPLFIELGARGDVPVSRYRFVYEDSTERLHEVHRMNAVVLGLDLGLGVRF